jgi:ribosome-associated toxin RatA of RatAB toxin-antitoxin module
MITHHTTPHHIKQKNKKTKKPYTGKQIPLKVTSDQSSKLDKGEAILYRERSGKSGRGVVIQDVNAQPSICMEKIRDLKNYPKMVPHCKKVEVYEDKKEFGGVTRTCAKFEVGVMGMTFGYFLKLAHMPQHNTLTWTLDYRYSSDFDDNVGHWQVVPHPQKAGWTRVLYSTKVKLFKWIPEFIVSFLTGKALVESTSWVKRESEKEAEKRRAANKGGPGADFEKLLPPWLKKKGGATPNWLNMIKGGAIPLPEEDSAYPHRESRIFGAVRPTLRLSPR